MSDSAVRKKISLRLKGDGEHKSGKESKPQTKATHHEPPNAPPDAKVSKMDSVGFPLNRGKALNWNQPINFCAKTAKEPLVHICEQCQLPILIYGRMKKCRHAFCRDCTKKAGGKCFRCGEGGQEFDESSMGAVHVCTYGGGRYDNKGCGRSYLSKRDLDAHMAYRHNTVPPNQQPAAPMVPAPPAFYPFPPGLPPPPLPPAPGIPPMQPQRMPPPHADNVHLMRPPPSMPVGPRPPPPVLPPGQWTPSSSGV